MLGGHVIDASGHNTYASNMTGTSARILLLIAAVNNLLVKTGGDIGKASLHASTPEKYTNRQDRNLRVLGMVKQGEQQYRRKHCTALRVLRIGGMLTERPQSDLKIDNHRTVAMA